MDLRFQAPAGRVPLERFIAISVIDTRQTRLCLLLRGESKGGQMLTTRHPAYAGKLKTPRRIQWYEDTPLDKGGSPAEEHAWFLWDWRRDATRMPFDASPGDPRLRACEVCGALLDGHRRQAIVCSAGCR